MDYRFAQDKWRNTRHAAAIGFSDFLSKVFQDLVPLAAILASTDTKLQSFN
jgi:hypothetical protein